MLWLTDWRIVWRVGENRSDSRIEGGGSLQRSGGGCPGHGPGPDRFAAVLLLLVELSPPPFQVLKVPGDLLPAATDDVLQEVLKLFLLDGVGLGQLAEVSVVLVLVTRISCSRAELSQHTRCCLRELNPAEVFLWTDNSNLYLMYILPVLNI